MRMNKEKTQVLADKLSLILPIIDNFMNELDDKDFELLEQSKEVLEEKINTNNSALVIINACGGDYDDTEDRMKVKTLECLIELIKVRLEYRDEMLKKEKQKDNEQEVLKLFGLL